MSEKIIGKEIKIIIVTFFIRWNKRHLSGGLQHISYSTTYKLF